MWRILKYIAFLGLSLWALLSTYTCNHFKNNSATFQDLYSLCADDKSVILKDNAYLEQQVKDLEASRTETVKKEIENAKELGKSINQSPSKITRKRRKSPPQTSLQEDYTTTQPIKQPFDDCPPCRCTDQYEEIKINGIAENENYSINYRAKFIGLMIDESFLVEIISNRLKKDIQVNDIRPDKARILQLEDANNKLESIIDKARTDLDKARERAEQNKRQSRLMLDGGFSTIFILPFNEIDYGPTSSLTMNFQQGFSLNAQYMYTLDAKQHTGQITLTKSILKLGKVK